MWLLAQHPEVVASFHGGFFQSLQFIDSWRKTPGSFGKFIVPALSANIGNNNRKIDLVKILPPNLFHSQLIEISKEYFNILSKYGNNPQAIVENTPEDMELMLWILDLFPEAYILHVVRDPRSIWLSIRNALNSWNYPKKSETFPPTLPKNLRRWCRYLNLGRKIQLKAQHYYEFKYETLHENGAEELERIFHWLGLEADQEFCEQAMKNATIEKLKRAMPSPKGFFGKGKTNSWKDSLSNSEIKQIEYLGGVWLDYYNYERQFPPSSRSPWQLRLIDGISHVSDFLKRRLLHW